MSAIKKIIGIFSIYIIIYLLVHFFNHLQSLGETPQVTDYNEQECYGRNGKLGYSYTFYIYYLHDETRQCHLGKSETFYIIKKEARISRDDHCDHCNVMWS